MLTTWMGGLIIVKKQRTDRHDPYLTFSVNWTKGFGETYPIPINSRDAQNLEGFAYASSIDLKHGLLHHNKPSPRAKSYTIVLPGQARISEVTYGLITACDTSPREDEWTIRRHGQPKYWRFPFLIDAERTKNILQNFLRWSSPCLTEKGRT
jgi:hypothetical protein